MARLITIGAAIAATGLALGCSRSLTPDDAGGSSGLGGFEGIAGVSGTAGVTGAGGAIGAGGATGVVGGGGAGAARDGGADASSCVATCGMVAGVLPSHDCIVPLVCDPPSGFTALVVFVNAELTARDTSHAEGWDYTDASMTAIELHGDACAVLMTSSTVPVDVDYLCEVAAP